MFNIAGDEREVTFNLSLLSSSHVTCPHEPTAKTGPLSLLAWVWISSSVTTSPSSTTTTPLPLLLCYTHAHTTLFSLSSTRPSGSNVRPSRHPHCLTHPPPQLAAARYEKMGQ